MHNLISALAKHTPQVAVSLSASDTTCEDRWQTQAVGYDSAALLAYRPLPLDHCDKVSRVYQEEGSIGGPSVASFAQEVVGVCLASGGAVHDIYTS